MFSRHDLVWLAPSGWERACAAAPPGSREAIARWGDALWPAVVTRVPAGFGGGQHASETAADAACPPEDGANGGGVPGDGANGGSAQDRVALGIALPPREADGSKPRIALGAAIADVTRTSPALLLAQAIHAAPPAWRTALAALEQEAADAGCLLRVYGSLAFGALTGQAYLRPASDVDLLLHPATASDCQAALALLVRHARVLPLDGEIVFGGGWAVAWKELAAAPQGKSRVLAKSLQGVALMTVDSLLASLDEAATCTA